MVVELVARSECARTHLARVLVLTQKTIYITRNKVLFYIINIINCHLYLHITYFFASEGFSLTLAFLTHIFAKLIFHRLIVILSAYEKNKFHLKKYFE